MQHFVFSFLFFVLFLSGAYYQVLSACYGFADDYYLFHANYPLKIAPNHIADGRPLYAYLAQYFSAVHSICGLKVIRFLSIVGNALLLSALSYSLWRNGWTRIQASLFSFVFCLTPPIGVYIGWATMMPFAYGSTFALFSGLLAANAATRSTPPTRALLQFVGATVLLLFSLTIYQPTSCFFWFPPISGVILRGVYSKTTSLFLCKLLLFFSVVVLLYYFSYQFGVWPFTSAPSFRGNSLVDDVAERVREFFIWPLADVLNSLRFDHGLVFTLCSLSLILIGLLSLSRRRLSRGSYLVLLYSLAVPLSYYPSLVSKGLSLNFRAASALYAIFLFFIFLGLIELNKKISSKFLKKFFHSCSALFLFYAVYNANWRIDKLIVIPQTQELDIVTTALDNTYSSCPKEVNVIRPGLRDSLASIRYDEFGIPTTFHGWGPGGVIAAVLREKYSSCQNVKINSFESNSETEHLLNLIDLKKLFSEKKLANEKRRKMPEPTLFYHYYWRIFSNK